MKSIHRLETGGPASGESGHIKHKVVSERFSYTPVVITLDKYSDVLRTTLADATEKLAGIIFGDST